MLNVTIIKVKIAMKLSKSMHKYNYLQKKKNNKCCKLMKNYDK